MMVVCITKCVFCKIQCLNKFLHRKRQRIQGHQNVKSQTCPVVAFVIGRILLAFLRIFFQFLWEFSENTREFSENIPWEYSLIPLRRKGRKQRILSGEYERIFCENSQHSQENSLLILREYSLICWEFSPFSREFHSLHSQWWRHWPENILLRILRRILKRMTREFSENREWWRICLLSFFSQNILRNFILKENL